MKKYLFICFLTYISSFSQEIDSLKYKLKSINLQQTNKEREKQIRDLFDVQILKNKFINKDTLNMDYGLFVDKRGEIFVTYNEINDKIASNTFENIFKRTYFIMPFKDSLKLKIISYKFKGINRYIKTDSVYSKYIPIKKDSICLNNSIKQERVPIYRGCKKKSSNEELKKCMAHKITKLISKNFNVNLASKLNLSSGIKRIFIRFKVNKKGTVSDIKVRAPHPKLKREAIRVIKLIPKMKPGKQNGKVVNVKYALPIIFNVTD